MAVLYFVLSFIAAMLLFGLRRTRPFIYGVLETMVGTIGLVFAFYPQAALVPTAESTSLGLALSRGIAIVGAIYLLVRGMDNMERGLPQSWRPHWHALFSKRDEQIGG